MDVWRGGKFTLVVSQATREKVKGKTKEMKGGLVRRRGLVFTDDEGVRVRVGECEAGSV